MTIAEIIIITFCIIIGYTYFAYIGLLWLLAKFINKPVAKDESFSAELTIIIAAHNEEDLIRDCIESIFHSNYPLEKIFVRVGSDGSTDKTNEILDELRQKYPNLNYEKYNRCGKNAVLNQLIAISETPYILYLDADCRVTHNAIKNVMRNFADDTVGCVISKLEIISSDTENIGYKGESFYQSIESKLRLWESRISTTVNSLGTLYGIRKDIYEPLPDDAIVDDLFRVVHTNLKRKRVIYDDDAIVHEVRKKSLKDEMQRRIRIAAGGLNSVWFLKGILNPAYGWASLFVWSHKFLRWFTPFYLIVIAVCTAFLPIDSLVFWIVLISQIVLYLGAILGWLLNKLDIHIGIFKLLLFFVGMNYGFFFAVIRWIRGTRNAIWQHDFLKKDK